MSPDNADKNGWRTIESAPSDGSPVFVWGGYADHGTGKEFFPVKELLADGEWWRVCGLKSAPTHWQPRELPPLPPPPENAE